MKINEYLYEGYIGEIPLRIHWATLFIFIYAIPFSQNLFSYPIVVISYFLLILFHEIGHASICKILGYKILLIDIESIGGECICESPEQEYEMILISWGGILSQFFILILSFIVIFYMDKIGISSTNIFYPALLSVFIFLNILMIIINLLPFRKLDGYYALRIFQYFFKKFKFKMKKNVSTKNNEKQIKAKQLVNSYIQQIALHGKDSISDKQKNEIEWARKNLK